MTRTRIALALGSGGARGYAHIGVIQVLVERGFDIVAVAGSSMGAMVGGLHAADALDEYSEYATSLSQLDVWRLLDPSLSAAGAFKAEKAFGKVRDLLDGVLIEDLPIPFTAVATDLLAGREVWFQDGPADRAIRASIAIPTVITPVMYNGRLLADGGLLNPVPLAPLSAVRADATIAVSLGGERKGAATTAGGAPEHESAEARPVDEWSDRFRRVASAWLESDAIKAVTSRFERLRERGKGDDDELEEAEESLPAGLSKGDVLMHSIEVMQAMLTRYRIASYPPDVLISISRDACRALDFHRAAELIDVGRAAAEDALDDAGLTGTDAPD
ncbi:MAG TPA: patatin-like phospholipase family protein [Ilumatobacteraceae bacterium]|nr:patatin-like phospholipase family protein [Ilumatobacteraceae bacterium]